MSIALGLDIGSTTSKAVLLEDGHNVLASSVVTAGIGTKGAWRAVDDVLTETGLTLAGVGACAVTGYGRNTWQGEAVKVSELTCHALGAYHIFPAARTVIDIGGQDSKAIVLGDNGLMDNFQMNDKCAAGTGRFLEVMVRALQLDFAEFDRLARCAPTPAVISSTCTVFAESEVISQLAAGQDLASVAAGIVTSIGGRTATLARRVGVREQVCMSGGVARSQAVRDAVGKALGTQLLYSPFAQCFGALGAALYALRRAPKPADAPEDAWRRSQLAGPTELPLPGRRPASPEKE